MKLSISNRLGVIVAVTLLITLSSMLVILLTQEESLKRDSAVQNVNQLSSVISESITFSI